MTLVPAPQEPLNLLKTPFAVTKEVYGDVKTGFSALFDSRTRKITNLAVAQLPLNVTLLGGSAIVGALLTPVALPYAGIRKIKKKRASAHNKQPA